MTVTYYCERCRTKIRVGLREITCTLWNEQADEEEELEYVYHSRCADNVFAKVKEELTRYAEPYECNTSDK